MSSSTRAHARALRLSPPSLPLSLRLRMSTERREKDVHTTDGRDNATTKAIAAPADGAVQRPCLHDPLRRSVRAVCARGAQYSRRSVQTAVIARWSSREINRTNERPARGRVQTMSREKRNRVARGRLTGPSQKANHRRRPNNGFITRITGLIRSIAGRPAVATGPIVAVVVVDHPPCVGRRGSQPVCCARETRLRPPRTDTAGPVK
uniref:Uncharacterized protein n=1 Tax=Plectus sambesii TaxID=2011161 RepID=A0A914WS68_9BILA